MCTGIGIFPYQRNLLELCTRESPTFNYEPEFIIKVGPRSGSGVSQIGIDSRIDIRIGRSTSKSGGAKSASIAGSTSESGVSQIGIDSRIDIRIGSKPNRHRKQDRHQNRE
ncbi:hypothetical protein EVAR_61425_1 [Eumeta japonica]|uniref:Uncharacterized protein n=1 Tax=Eumeta variegata TaxID=151549 RepID=A0A4C1Y4T0_EUMVA|nr:hypothetical protein EVAR_61425_1 [Eumeta japonica]